MQCPACVKELKERNVGGVTVEICQGGCGGMWFDRFELNKFDEPHEEAGLELLEFERESLPSSGSKRLKCPRCGDPIMMRHFFSVNRGVEVDECPGCGGFWLDCGELHRIRSEFPSEAARKKAAEEYFNEVLGPKLAAMRAESGEKAARARRIVNMFRFVCPSYYIPGKQEGGAF